MLNARAQYSTDQVLHNQVKLDLYFWKANLEIMALETFAVIGKDNTPLYLCDFSHESDDLAVNDFLRNDWNDGNDKKDNQDCFGFFDHRPNNPNDKCSLKNQVSQVQK